MLEKPLATVKHVAGRAVMRPVGLGLTTIGRTIGLAKGTGRALVGLVPGRPSEPPEDAEAPAPRPPSPPDVAAATPEPAAAVSAEEPHDEEPLDEEPLDEEPGVTTPVGTTGADVAHNPDTTDTDLQQPGTEPLMDPATTKAVASEAETLRRAAETDKG